MGIWLRSARLPDRVMVVVQGHTALAVNLNDGFVRPFERTRRAILVDRLMTQA
jgi:hypothetical protein